MTRGALVFAAMAAGSLATAFAFGRNAEFAWLTVWPVAAGAGALQIWLGVRNAAAGWWVAVAIRSGGGLVSCLIAERWTGAGVGENRPLWFWFLGHYWTSLVADAVAQLWRPGPAKRD
jgi:hypothetical protein